MIPTGFPELPDLVKTPKRVVQNPNCHRKNGNKSFVMLTDLMNMTYIALYSTVTGLMWPFTYMAF